MDSNGRKIKITKRPHRNNRGGGVGRFIKTIIFLLDFGGANWAGGEVTWRSKQREGDVIYRLGA